MTWQNELVSFAQSNLTDYDKDYLYGRGVSDEQMQEFHLGLIRDTLPSGLGSPSFLKWLEDSRTWRNSYVFPLTNVLGEVHGFQFKSFEGKLYSTFLESPGEMVTFGLSQCVETVWKTKTIWLVEGVFDLFPIHRHFQGVACVLTAAVNEPGFKQIRRLARRVLLGFDMDVAGRRGCWDFVKEHGKKFDAVEIITYPSLPLIGVEDKRSKDPGDVWGVWGDEKFGPFVKKFVSREVFDV
jgi:DNA primase